MNFKKINNLLIQLKELQKEEDKTKVEIENLDKKQNNFNIRLQIENLFVEIVKNIDNLGINAVDIALIPEIEIPSTKVQTKIKNINKNQYLIIKELKKQNIHLLDLIQNLMSKI